MIWRFLRFIHVCPQIHRFQLTQRLKGLIASELTNMHNYWWFKGYRSLVKITLADKLVSHENTPNTLFLKNAFYFSINIFVKQIIFLKEQDENWCRVNICPSNSKYFLPTSVIRWPGYVSYYLIKTKFYLALWRKSFFFKLAWCPADNDSSLSSCLWFPYQYRH